MSFPISCNAITKSYGTKQVLEDVNLEVKPGEMFGLIGVNGAGKTTLIKMLLDLITIDEGSAQLFDLPTTNTKARHKLSYLPEKFQPSRYLYGKEYLQLSLSYYGKKFDLAHAKKMAALLDLDPEVLEHKVGSYSKGMGQKLGLLGAFLVATPLLILDEPMSGLDPGARIKLKRMLLDTKDKGSTVFFSSHILADIEEICDRIGVIHDGKLFFVGTPEAFKQQYPAATLEQSFLNAINVDEKAA